MVVSLVSPVQQSEVAESASEALSSLSPVDSLADDREDSLQEPIDFENARLNYPYYEEETAEDMQLSGAKREDRDVAKKIRRLVRRNPLMSSAEIAQKVACSRSYAGKLKSQILREEVQDEHA